MISKEQIDKFVKHCKNKLTLTEDILGYPNSAVLCALDAIFSLTAHYSSVVNVVTRYCQLLKKHVKKTELSNVNISVSEAINFIEENDYDGDSLADELGNRCTCPGTPRLKADCFISLLKVFKTNGVNTSDDLKAKIDVCSFEHACKKEKGVGDACYNYMGMLGGDRTRVKVDVHVTRFVENFDPSINKEEDIIELFHKTSKRLGNITPRHLDHMVWCYQRNAKVK